jgi:hypothetical protein
MKYYKISTDLGYSTGMNNYGYALAKGFNGEKILIEAMEYLKIPTDLENSDGMTNYFQILQNEINIEIHYSEVMSI